MIDGCFAVCFDLPEKKWMAIDSVALNRFYMALLILIFVPFASASGSISTWLSVFQLCELITGFVILEFPPLYLLSRQVLLQNFFKYADL